jgi:hypothetical protein
MIQTDGAIRTDQMSLAVVLSLAGYDLVMERIGEVAFWVIIEDEADELAMDIVEEYVSGACRVEPRNFMRESKVVRERLYDFLGYRGRVRGPVAGSSPAGDAANSR